MCALIRTTGISDTAAGAASGLSRAAVSRWKQDEDVEVGLGQARAQYLLPRLAAIAETRLRDGRIDWRAQAWLIKFAHPEEYGRPSGRRRLEKVELPGGEEARTATAAAGRFVAPSPSMGEVSAAPRRAGETGSRGESVAFRSEIAVGAVEGGLSVKPEKAPHIGSENVAFRSEIREPRLGPASVRPEEAPHIPSENVAFRSEIAAGPIEAGSLRPREVPSEASLAEREKVPSIGRELSTCASGLNEAGTNHDAGSVGLNNEAGAGTGCRDLEDENVTMFPETTEPAGPAAGINPRASRRARRAEQRQQARAARQTKAA